MLHHRTALATWHFYVKKCQGKSNADHHREKSKEIGRNGRGLPDLPGFAATRPRPYRARSHPVGKLNHFHVPQRTLCKGRLDSDSPSCQSTQTPTLESSHWPQTRNVPFSKALRVAPGGDPPGC